MRLANALLYSFIFSLYGGCFYFAFGMFHAAATNGNITSFLGEFLVAMLVCFGFLTMIFYDLGGLFERLNKPDSKNNNKNDSDHRNVGE